MDKLNRPVRLLLLIIGLVAGISLVPSLSSCSVVNDTISFISNDDAELTHDTRTQLERFEAIYNKYVIAGAGRAARSNGLDQFRDAFMRVRYDYVRDVPESVLVDTAIEGIEGLEPKPMPGKVESAVLIEAALDKMMTSLDPHSSYLNSDELREMKVSNRGEFGGLGIEVTMDGDFVKVVSPIEDTPAARAGLISGDLISHLNGQAIKGKSLMQAVRLMRGKPGTIIVLTIKRGDLDAFDVDIRRAIINVRSVRWRLENNIGYIRVVNFSEKVAPGIDDAMDEITSKLGKSLAGIVLDLRNNPGGLLHQSLTLSDAFLERGTIVSVRGRRQDSERVFKAERGDLADGLPIVVLINPGSASASEIVAAALQDHGRAVIMGQRSFGKGSVQTITPLPQEGALRLTTQLYYSPTGHAIQARGITPDIEIVPAPIPAADGQQRPLAKDQDATIDQADDAAAKDAAKPVVARRREADLPGAIAPVGEEEAHPHPKLPEQSCQPVGEKKDRTLGCALALIRAGSQAEFLASIKQNPAM